MAINFNGNTVKSIQYTDENGVAHALNRLYKNNQLVWVRPCDLSFTKNYENPSIRVITTEEPSASANRYLDGNSDGVTNTVYYGDYISFYYWDGSYTETSPSNPPTSIESPVLTGYYQHTYRITVENDNDFEVNTHIAISDRDHPGYIMWNDTITLSAGASKSYSLSLKDGVTGNIIVEAYNFVDIVTTTHTYTGNYRLFSPDSIRSLVIENNITAYTVSGFIEGNASRFTATHTASSSSNRRGSYTSTIYINEES